ncbi:MAG TPA: agmatinase family protein [Acidimicrobiia bacterium]|nr:agmatinase family protein [Acidimicrobiia bacterium]
MPITDPDWPRADVWLASESNDPDVLVVGVPSSKASLSPSRADLAPLVVRDRLHRFSTYQGELGVDFADVRVRDVGNWPVSELDRVPLVGEMMRLASGLPDADLTLFLGGDNAITRPLVASQSDDLARVGLITFDAHHDVRSLENGPTNGTPVRGLVEEHGLPGQNIVQIGIHSFANSAIYRAYCDANGITTVTVDQVERIGMKATVDVAISQLSATCESIYVDVDIDVLDRAFAPACPGARPGGLTVRQLTAGVVRSAAHPSVTAMDFVEVDPEADIDHQTMDVMAHLLLSAVVGYATRSH